MANLLYPATTGHYVDDKYSALLEPNLFAKNVFQPNITFTAKYQTGPAGQIFVHKPGIGTVSPTHPGADFSDTIVQDSLITIALDQQFARSRKMYGVTQASVSYPMAAAEMEAAIAEIKAAWNLQAAKSLIGESSILVSDNLLTLTSASTIYGQIVDDRQKMRAAKANPNVLIVSPKVYGYLLKSDEFQRIGAIGDNTVSNGMVGRIAGLDVFEYESLNSAAVNGASIGGITWVAADDELEYVMYDSDAFSIVTSVEAIRLVEEPTRFVGTLAQVQIVSGFKLTNPSRALLKFHDYSAS